MIKNYIILFFTCFVIVGLIACTANLKATDIETGVVIENPMKDGGCNVQNGKK